MSSPPPGPGAVLLEVEHDPRINYALQQNAIPLIKRIRIHNQSPETLVDVRLEVLVEPELAEPWVTRIASIAPGATYTLDRVDVPLRARQLVNLLERELGELRLLLWCGEEELARTRRPVEVLAYNEWPGILSLPEILAAFVLPNHPGVVSLLREAREHLREATRDASLDGYQSASPRRVRAQVTALFRAAQLAGITYINPPASFEREGQKIRTPDQVLQDGMGTCLDLAVLLAGALEHAGLHPVLVLQRGHAMVGVWLQEDTFAEPTCDDGIRLRKLVDLGEILVLDPTLVCRTPAVPFSRTEQEGRRALEDEAIFACAVDVRGARRAGIRPLPLRLVESPFEAVETVTPMEVGHAPAAAPSSAVAPEPTPRVVVEEAPRLQHWKRQLLDLTLRNRLLNHRETRQVIPLLSHDLACLEDAMSSGRAFRLCARPSLLDEHGVRDAQVHLERTGEELLASFLREEEAAGRLHSSLPAPELADRLLRIYRSYRLSLQEGGANTLFLALGFLDWYEGPEAGTPRQAPLVLLPLELHRRSVAEGFTLRLSEEEIRVNVSLLRKLEADWRITIPDLEVLPEDAAGVDVPAILRRFREAVKDIPRWEVREEACVALYSFTKYLMWKDLQDRSAVLLENPVVRHLVETPGQSFQQDGTFLAEGDLDVARSPADTLCPLDADSSQLGAVYAAADGLSYVLQGPPGTGKSQTITNLVCHNLGLGRTVLFVSEKMAALEVVKRRLERVGLGPFCLEVHSRKASKPAVLGQLDATLRIAQAQAPGVWARQAEALGAVRGELNRYVEAMHRTRPYGCSVYQVLSRLISLREVPHRPHDFGALAAATADRLPHLRTLLEALIAAASSVGVPDLSPWHAVHRQEWTPALGRQLTGELQSLVEAADLLEETTRACASDLGLTATTWSEEDLTELETLSDLLFTSPGMPVELVTDEDWEARRALITGWVERGRRRARLRARLDPGYRRELLELPLEDLLAAYQRWGGSLLRWITLRGARRQLREVSRDGKVGRAVEVVADLQTALQLREEEERLAAAASQAERWLGRHWAEDEPVWDRIEQALDWVARLRQLTIRRAGADLAVADRLRLLWGGLGAEAAEVLAPGTPLGDRLRSFREGCTRLRSRRLALEGLLELDREAAFGAPGSPGYLERLRQVAATWEREAQGLRYWCAYVRARAPLLAEDLDWLVQRLAADEEGPRVVLPVLERAWYEWCLERTLEEEELLRHFTGEAHERRIQQFRELDEAVMELASEEVVARLAARVPRVHHQVAEESEVGILQREVKKKSRHLPVRQLFHRIPNLLPRIAPCLLMSPLSVAQYLDPTHPPFDLVVFDEASQIPVWDAVGALARGRQAVVVGDSKQLPPTTFFHRTGTDDVPLEDELEELESILDECVAARLPSRHLLWHYRSRHESLITFSNYHYYQSSLVTFPAAAIEARHLGVRLRRVPDGVYDRARSRTNRREAELLVQEVVCRLLDPVACQRSIGIVTFSMPQQTLVEDLLEDARCQFPDLEPFFSDDLEEPVFVKNLENVQGDERDLILFSICYGPDAGGQVSMNFGPLNRQGGERRLNVAITRAREQLLVFATLQAHQIDLNRTTAVGAAHLKSFLEYAEEGPQAMAQATSVDPRVEQQAHLERSILDALEGRGHQVERNIGCSAYRVDVGVRDPQHPTRYLLGIECDGPVYQRAATARDRDRNREAVLRRLGWDLHRVWAADWWLSKDRELARLEKALDRAADRAAREPEEPPEPAPVELSTAPGVTPGGSGDAPTGEVGAPELPPAEEPTGAPADGPAPSGGTATPEPAPAPPAEPTNPEVEPTPALPDAPAAPGPATLTGQETYPRALPVVTLGTPEELHHPRSEEALRRALQEITARESPVQLQLASRRVAAAFGVTRLTRKVRERLLEVAQTTPGVHLVPPTTEGVLWQEGQDPEHHRAFRVPAPDEPSPRQIDEIPTAELAHAAGVLLQQQVALPREALARATARLFGVRRLGKTVRACLEEAIALLEERGACVLEGEIVRLP